MARPTVSYAQRFEDLYLMRCFAAGRDGFYIDIGSGHPVYDNTSFAFYLKGWHGITVEPNPWLARLSRAVRPRDRHIEALVGATVGEAVFYLVNDFHGFSTMIESHARAAQTQFGKSSGHCRSGDNPPGPVPTACAARIRFPQSRRGGRGAGRAAQRRLAELSAEGGGGRGARTLHAGTRLGGVGTVSRKTRLPLRLVRQSQPLLPRRGGERTCTLFRERAGLLRRRCLSVPQRQAGACGCRASRSPAGEPVGGQRHDAPTAARARGAR